MKKTGERVSQQKGGAVRKSAGSISPKILALSIGAVSLCTTALTNQSQAQAAPGLNRSHSGSQSNKTEKTERGGQLLAFAQSGKALGECPLKHTDVTATISGYVARVNVKQQFHNPFKNKIEAQYTFPLSESGAVDEMTMKIGDRVVKGTIKKREEARAIYEHAKEQGHVASLLDQERTNIFNQSVANIEPGQTVEITISYVEMLPFENGKYSYTFPMVVGPRFIPGQPTGASSGGTSPPTERVPDADLITPHITPPTTRLGHDISLHVNLDAGMPVSGISSKLHQITVAKDGDDRATINLTDQETIPNKDFVLNWDVAPANLQSGCLTYRDAKTKEGFFSIMLVPPAHVQPKQVSPKEMVFLIDCSGSQSGAPLEKAKETLRYIIDKMNPQDTFQILAFSDRQTLLFDKPTGVSEEMKNKAKKFIDALSANGGTWMAPAVQKILDMPSDSSRLRIVTFMTDGYVGNDLEILGLIHKYRATTRWFSFGTGNSVNRMLIDGIAKEGGGEADYVLLNSSAQEVGKKFYDKISSPVLTNVKLDFGNLPVKEVFPREASDVWSQRPLYFKGRFTAPASGTITLSGMAQGKPYKQSLKVNFPEATSDNSALASVWARAKVDRLISEDYIGAQNGNPNKEIKDEITNTALQHHIMTNYTSFVAVEETTKVKDGKVIKMQVPVALPDGVSDQFAAADYAMPKGAMLRRYTGRASGKAMAAPMSIPAPMPIGATNGTLGASYAPEPPKQISLKPSPRLENVAKKSNDGASAADAKNADMKKLDHALLSKYQASRFSTAAEKHSGSQRISIRVKLSRVDAETLEALKAAGFIVDRTKGQVLEGRIKISHLDKLIALGQVLEVHESANKEKAETESNPAAVSRSTTTTAPHLVQPTRAMPLVK